MAKTGSQSDSGRPRTGLVVGFFLGVVTLVACGFPLTIAAQVQAPVDIRPSTISEGDVFQISMIISQVRPDQVNPERVSLPDGLRLVETFTERSGESGQDTRFAVRMRAERPGFFELPALRVSAAGREMSTGAILIQVHPAIGGDVPFEGYWKLNREHPVAGESLLISLMLQAPGSPVFPDTVQFTPPPWGDFHEVAGVGDISATEFATGTLYEIPVITYIATPSGSGEYTIPAAVIDVGESRITVDSLDFRVGASPRQIAASGAVGDFQYTASIEPSEVYQGETVAVHIRLEGQGNLPYIQLPEPQVENLIITNVDEFERIQPTGQGFMGVRSATYRLSTRDPGRYLVELPTFYWFSPDESRVFTGGAAARTIQVHPVPIGSDEDARTRMGLLSSDEISGLPAVPGSEGYVALAWVLPAAAALLLRKIVSTRFGRAVFIAGLSALVFPAVPAPYIPIEAEAAEHQFRAGDFAAAHHGYDELIEQHPELPGLWYNAGLSAYRAGNRQTSVHHFRKALSLRPDMPAFSEALIWTEQDLDLTAQVEPPPAVSTGVFLAALVFMVNAMVMLWLFFRVRKMGGVAVLFICLGIACALLLLGLLRAAQLHSRDIAILGDSEQESVLVYRIPVEDVTPWMNLAAGTAVELLDVSEGFYLIETGPGVQGWVAEDHIIRL